ncbi:unnamed protein product, partial [Mesorhabditis spiculigera]
MYTASLAATTRMDSHEIAIAYAMLAIGAGEFCAGTFFGISGNSRGSQFGRKRVAVIGTCLLLVANVLSIINLPPDAPLHETDNIGFIEPSLWIALFVAFLLGLADCCWQTQTYTILGGMYKDEQSPPAFALFRCFQALSTSIGCFIAPQFELYWTLLMTSVLSIAASCAFCAVNKMALERYHDDIEKSEFSSIESQSPPPSPTEEKITSNFI